MRLGLAVAVPSVACNPQAAQLAKGPGVGTERPDGSWYKVLGLNPKYDLYDCQVRVEMCSGGGL